MDGITFSQNVTDVSQLVTCGYCGCVVHFSYIGSHTLSHKGNK